MSVDAHVKTTAFSIGDIGGRVALDLSKTVRLKVFIIEAKITELKLGLTFIHLEICSIGFNRLSRRILLP